MIKSKNIYGILLLSAIFAFFNLTVYADPGQGQGQGRGKGNNMKQRHGGPNAQHGKAHGIGHSASKAPQINTKNIKFSHKDRTAITNYFNATPFHVATLPPGIAMNLARGKPLPPGIAKVYLPSNLVKTLPVYPGYEYLAVGPNVVLANTKTGVIAEIISNVLR